MPLSTLFQFYSSVLLEETRETIDLLQVTNTLPRAIIKLINLVLIGSDLKVIKLLSEIFVLVLKKRPFRSVHLIGNTQSPDLDDFGVGVRNTCLKVLCLQDLIQYKK